MPNLVIQMGENPLGRRGACVLLRANASKCVKLIDIQKAALRDNQQPKLIDDSIDGGGLPPACPVYHPSRASFVYRLDLAKADHREVKRRIRAPCSKAHQLRPCCSRRQVLMKLLRVHARDGPETWHEAYLDSRPITMNDQLCQKWLQGPSPEALASLARMKETELSKKLDEKARKAKKVAENHSKQAQGMPVEGYFVVRMCMHPRWHHVQWRRQLVCSVGEFHAG